MTKIRTTIPGSGSGSGADVALEGKLVRTTRFVSISSGTSGTVSLPANSTVVLNDFGGTVDAVVNTEAGGRPTFESAREAGGAIVATTFNSSGDYVFTGTPSAYPVDLIYRVEQTAINFDSASTDIIGPPQTVNGGVTHIADVGAAPNAQGGTIAGVTLQLQPAGATLPGVMTAAGQFFGGSKGFFDPVVVGGTATAGAMFTARGASNGAAYAVAAFLNPGGSILVSLRGNGAAFFLGSTAGLAVRDVADFTKQLNWHNASLGTGVAVAEFFGIQAGNRNFLRPTLTADDTYVFVGSTQVIEHKTVRDRVVTIADAATLVINADTCNVALVPTLGQASSIAAITGLSLAAYQPLQIRFQTSTSRALTWDAVFRGGSIISLLSATTGASKSDYVGLRYHASDGRWDIIAKSTGY